MALTFMEIAISATEIYKNYQGEHALAGVSLAIKKGTMYGLIGADGAGKSTLMRILCTLVDADTGNAFVHGFSVQTHIREIRSILGYMPQKFSLYEDLSVSENMIFFADVFGVTGKEREKRISRLLEFSRLGPFVNRRARNLSGGMKQKLALSCALIHTPRILILDEPTTGVDPVSRKEFWAILQSLKNDGITILVSTPYMDEADYCDGLSLLHNGEVVVSGDPSNLRSAYPFALFRASHKDVSINLPKSRALTQGIARAYPVGGCIHVAMFKDVADPTSVIKSFLPECTAIDAIEPRMEDLFFALVTQGEKKRVA